MSYCPCQLNLPEPANERAVCHVENFFVKIRKKIENCANFAEHHYRKSLG